MRSTINGGAVIENSDDSYGGLSFMENKAKLADDAFSWNASSDLSGY